MTANQFLQETGYNKVCTCSLKNKGRLYCNESVCKRSDQPCTCGKVSFCPQSCENRIPDREELIERLKKAVSYWEEMDAREVPFWSELLDYIVATPPPTEPPDIDDKVEILDRIRQTLEFDMPVYTQEMLQECYNLIKDFPVFIVDTKGRRYCACENQHWNMSRYPDIAQAAQDADAEAQLIPVPTEKQWSYFGFLFKKASFAQRKKVAELLKQDPKKLMSEIIKILERS